MGPNFPRTVTNIFWNCAKCFRAMLMLAIIHTCMERKLLFGGSKREDFECQYQVCKHNSQRSQYGRHIHCLLSFLSLLWKAWTGAWCWKHVVYIDPVVVAPLFSANSHTEAVTVTFTVRRISFSTIFLINFHLSFLLLWYPLIPSFLIPFSFWLKIVLGLTGSLSLLEWNFLCLSALDITMIWIWNLNNKL